MQTRSARNCQKSGTPPVEQKVRQIRLVVEREQRGIPGRRIIDLQSSPRTRVKRVNPRITPMKPTLSRNHHGQKKKTNTQMDRTQRHHSSRHFDVLRYLMERMDLQNHAKGVDRSSSRCLSFMHYSACHRKPCREERLGLFALRMTCVATAVWWARTRH